MTHFFFLSQFKPSTMDQDTKITKKNLFKFKKKTVNSIKIVCSKSTVLTDFSYF